MGVVGGRPEAELAVGLPLEAEGGTRWAGGLMLLELERLEAETEVEGLELGRLEAETEAEVGGCRAEVAGDAEVVGEDAAAREVLGELSDGVVPVDVLGKLRDDAASREVPGELSDGAVPVDVLGKLSDDAAAREVLGELSEGPAPVDVLGELSEDAAALLSDGVAEEMIACGAARVVAAKRRMRELGVILVVGCLGEDFEVDMLENCVLKCCGWCWQGGIGCHIYTEMAAVMASQMRWKAWLSTEARLRAKGACPYKGNHVFARLAAQQRRQASAPLLMCKATTTEAKPKRKVNGWTPIIISHIEYRHWHNHILDTKVEWKGCISMDPLSSLRVSSVERYGEQPFIS